MSEFPSWDGDATDVATLEVLAALIRLQKPDVCVEAGTYKGHGAIYMAKALQKNGRGVLVTADPYDHGQNETLAPYECVWFHPGDFMEALELIDEPIDFAFIDASGPGYPRDASIRWPHFEATRKKLAPGGVICVHDTAAESWTDGEDGASLDRIRDACQINLRGGRGLSIYHR